MNELNPLHSISYLRVYLEGSAYNRFLEEKVEKEFSDYPFQSIVRGMKAPAAGVALSVDVVLTVAAGVASGLVVEALKAVVVRINNAARDASSSNCHLRRVVCEIDHCDFIITDY